MVLCVRAGAWHARGAMSARSNPPMPLASGASSDGVNTPARDGAWPHLDDHLVEPGSCDEVIAGRRVYAAPSLPEHGDPHCHLDAVITVSVSPGYVASTDMITRSGASHDFASDTSVRRAGTDPATGERYLEELAIEVENHQKLQEVTDKAVAMHARGVRRVFAIFARKRTVCEWIHGAWQVLHDDVEVVDPCLVTPVQVRALVDAASFGRTAVRGLLARHEPALLDEIAAEKALSALTAQRALLPQLIDARGWALSAAQRARTDACDDAAQLVTWARRVVTAATLDEVFGAEAIVG